MTIEEFKNVVAAKSVDARGTALSGTTIGSKKSNRND